MNEKKGKPQTEVRAPKTETSNPENKRPQAEFSTARAAMPKPVAKRPQVELSAASSAMPKPETKRSEVEFSATSTTTSEAEAKGQPLLPKDAKHTTEEDPKFIETFAVVGNPDDLEREALNRQLEAVIADCLKFLSKYEDFSHYAWGFRWLAKLLKDPTRKEDIEEYRFYLNQIKTHHERARYAPVNTVIDVAMGRGERVKKASRGAELHTQMRHYLYQLQNRVVERSFTPQHIQEQFNHLIEETNAWKEKSEALQAQLAAQKKLYESQIKQLCCEFSEIMQEKFAAQHEEIEQLQRSGKAPQGYSKNKQSNSEFPSSQSFSGGSKSTPGLFTSVADYKKPISSTPAEFKHTRRLSKINEKDGEALIAAAKNGDINTIKRMILENNFHYILDYRDAQKYTALNHANERNHKEIVVILNLTAQVPQLHTAIKEGDIATVKKLLKQDREKVLLHARYNRDTALHCAISCGQYEVMLALLEFKPDLELLGDAGYPVLALFMSSALGIIDLEKRAGYLRAILKTNPDVNAFGSIGNTPLMLACMNGWLEGARILLQAKANVNQVGDCNRTSSDKVDAKSQEQIKMSWTALDQASMTDSPEFINELIAYKADFNRQDPHLGYSPLHWAVVRSAKNAVQTLLEHNARTDLIDNEGNTCFHLAATCNQPTILALLCGKKDTLPQLLRTNNQGLTPLAAAKQAQASSKEPSQWNGIIEKLVNMEKTAGVQRLEATIAKGVLEAIDNPSLGVEPTSYAGLQANFVRLKIPEKKEDSVGSPKKEESSVLGILEAKSYPFKASQNRYLLRIISPEECYELPQINLQATTELESFLTLHAVTNESSPFLPTFPFPQNAYDKLSTTPVIGPLIKERIRIIEKSCTEEVYDRSLETSVAQQTQELTQKFYCTLRVQEEFTDHSTLAFPLEKKHEADVGKSYWCFADGKKTVSQVAFIFRQLVLAFQYLHEEAHYVHRDLNPGNILFRQNAEGQITAVKLIDFEKARRMDRTGRITAEVTSKGFSSPHLLASLAKGEPARGKAEDYHQFALLLFEVLTETCAPSENAIHDLLRARGFRIVSEDSTSVDDYYVEYSNVLYQLLKEQYEKSKTRIIQHQPKEEQLLNAAWKLIEEIITARTPMRSERINLLNSEFLRDAHLCINKVEPVSDSKQSAPKSLIQDSSKFMILGGQSRTPAHQPQNGSLFASSEGAAEVIIPGAAPSS